MPALFIELFSEEIPARMQARAAEDLSRLVSEALAALSPAATRTFHGPRRIALAADMSAGVAASRTVERGPRASAPPQALDGFLRKHGATRDDLRQEGEFWVLDRAAAGIDAAALIASAMPGLLRRFPWPKSMRWGGTSAFTWVRPLRRIVCLLDGAVVRFDLRDGADDGHGLASGNTTEGHRFLSPDPFHVSGVEDWAAKLRERHVIVDAAERRQTIAQGIKALAAERQVAVVDDPGLLDEVAGLVEWPVPLLGHIDAAHMDLPLEVMQVSMRVNQRYFALRNADGSAAASFAFAANIAAPDGGRAIVAGNERVLRARFSDARHFWDLDRTHTLESRVAALDRVTFHAKLGTQGDRVRRLVRLAAAIAPRIGADPALAERAALLAKADLTSGMVGEFPELQGVMGGYYARHDREDPAVADAVRDHYAPKGPTDAVPAHPVGIAVALADKLDQLAAFFAIGEKPTGSGDPYALRRAALGIIRIVRETTIHLALTEVFSFALSGLSANGKEIFSGPNAFAACVAELRSFIFDRLMVQLRAEGEPHDVLVAVRGLDDDLLRLFERQTALRELLTGPVGADLLAGYKRAANILRAEMQREGLKELPAVDESLFEQAEERGLASELRPIEDRIPSLLRFGHFTEAMLMMVPLRRRLDAFFDKVTVNDTRAELRHNRLALLSRVRAAMNQAADFSKIEG